MKKVLKFFKKTDGLKETYDKKKIGLFSGIIFFFLIMGVNLFRASTSTSFVKQSTQRLSENKEQEQNGSTSPSSESKSQDATSNLDTEEETEKQNKRQVVRSNFQQNFARQNINFAGKQIFTFDKEANDSNSLPISTSMLGELTTGIDSRGDGTVRVNLPHGASFKGNKVIPDNSTLFGQASYPGDGDKVFINFNRGTFPNGTEFQISAQALSPRDFSLGIVGDHHGNTGSRIVSQVGLSLVAGIGESLQKNEDIAGSVVKRSTLENGLLSGLSKAADAESQRQLGELGSAKAYITVDSGEDLIISLTSPFVRKDL